MSRKKLTREDYKTKFETMVKRENWIFGEHEEIKQCNAPLPVYWFISSYGYLYSAYHNKIKVLVPNYSKCGSSRTENDWEYQYREPHKKTNTHIRAHKLVGEYFSDDRFVNLPQFKDDDIDFHHIHKKSNYKPNEGRECNRAENIQKLPKTLHKNVTKVDIDPHWLDKAIEEHPEQYQVLPHDLSVKIMEKIMQNKELTSTTPVVLHKITDNPDNQDTKVVMLEDFINNFSIKTEEEN